MEGLNTNPETGAASSSHEPSAHRGPQKSSTTTQALMVKKGVRRAELLKGHRHGFRRALD